ncbi:MAG: biopolymer transporter ExbD [Myxococcales bacterium]|nr:biopolymer transporter ExbD [Myxococcales bacterium]
MAVSVGGDEGGAMCEINVTPMVDVLLCLLIIFMVATPPPANTQMPLDIPTAPTTAPPANDPTATLLISIDAAGRATLGNQPLSADYTAMVAELKANPKLQNDGKCAIDAAKGVTYGQVIRVMGAAHEAGVTSVGIASDRL